MKEIPAGVGGSEGITGPCPGVKSITGKPVWEGVEGIDIGVPCCITADPGGEDPPGGKKTWAIGPAEDIHGLALAIQSLVCWLLEEVNIHTHKQAQVQYRVRKLHTHSNTHTDTHGHTLSRVPLPLVLCPPTLFDSRNNSLSRKQCLSPPFSHFFLDQSPSDFSYCPGMTGIRKVCWDS